MLTLLNDIRATVRNRHPLGMVSGSDVNNGDPFGSPFASPPLAKADRDDKMFSTAKGGKAGQRIRESALAALSKIVPATEPLVASAADESCCAVANVDDADTWASPPIAMQADMANSSASLSWSEGLAMALEAEAAADTNEPSDEFDVDVLSTSDFLSPNTRRTEDILSSPTFLAFFNTSPAAPSVNAMGSSPCEHDAQSALSEAEAVNVNGKDAPDTADDNTDAGTVVNAIKADVTDDPSPSPRHRWWALQQEEQWWTCFIVGAHEMLGCKLMQID